MKKTDSIVQKLRSAIKDRDILEVACGRAGFSASASSYAHSVSCIDLNDCRSDDVRQDNIHFEIMDAATMRYSDETFDAVFLYNAFAHIHSQWERIQKECLRVLRPGGSIYMIATWKCDIVLMREAYGDHSTWNGNFLITMIDKE